MAHVRDWQRFERNHGLRFDLVMGHFMKIVMDYLSGDDNDIRGFTLGYDPPIKVADPTAIKAHLDRARKALNGNSEDA